MALRNKMYLACESFLRVPPLLIVDEIFRYSFGLGFGGKFVQYGAILTISSNSDDNNKDSGTETESGEDRRDGNNFSENLYSTARPGGALSSTLETYTNAPYLESELEKIPETGFSSWVGDLLPSVSELWNNVVSEVSSKASDLTSTESLDSIVSFPSLGDAVNETSDNVLESTAHLLHVEFGDWDSVRDVVTDDVFKCAEVFGCLIGKF